MTAPTTTPRVTDCRAQIDMGRLALCPCEDCATVSAADVRHAELQYKLRAARRREAVRNGC